MKNYNYIAIILVVFNLIYHNGYTQQANEDTYIINQYFQLNKDATSIFQNKVPSSSNNIQSQGDFLNLKQVGTNNVININQKTNDSQAVNQRGDKNYYSFINYYNNTPSAFNIIQQGNSNSLQVYGENSIIKNMSIVQKSNFKTIIINNY